MNAMPQSLTRRRFLAALLGCALPHTLVAAAREVTLFFAGDVMTGRGIDQILPHPGKAHLFEPHMRSALGYVELAERASGPIKRPVDPAYVWGDALAVLEAARPAARIINLETAVTAAEDPWPRKAIHYRMHPANAACLAAAKIDCCVLANNHVLDWGSPGLAETLDTVRAMGIVTAGAGREGAAAAAPAVIELGPSSRVLVFAFGTASAGVPPEWAATPSRAGVNFLDALSARSLSAISQQVRAAKRPGDIVVVSLHWGGNWGYAVSSDERRFAHGLIDTAAVDVVHGHSSHHPKGIEIHAGRPILYGCGDLLNDYEGIGGHEAYRPDLALMYYPGFDTASGALRRLTMTPMQIRRFRVNRAPEEGARWLLDMLNREGRRFGTRVERQADESFSLAWT
jgi:poly-gamma-glutamate capsule biosynthesis protein CapA/YwtB (metallophosphatase superfamily)